MNLNNVGTPICAECTALFIKTSVIYGACPNGHGKLVRVRWERIERAAKTLAAEQAYKTAVEALPLAFKERGKWWTVLGTEKVRLTRVGSMKKTLPPPDSDGMQLKATVLVKQGQVKAPALRWGVFKRWEPKV